MLLIRVFKHDIKDNFLFLSMTRHSEAKHCGIVRIDKFFTQNLPLCKLKIILLTIHGKKKCAYNLIKGM